MTPIMKLFYKSPENGAQTQIMLSIEPQLEKITRKYFSGCKEKESSGKSKDEELASWVWMESAKLTGLEVAEK
jgi:hypothetical protein